MTVWLSQLLGGIGQPGPRNTQNESLEASWDAFVSPRRPHHTLGLILEADFVRVVDAVRVRDGEGDIPPSLTQRGAMLLVGRVVERKTCYCHSTACAEPSTMAS